MQIYAEGLKKGHKYYVPYKDEIREVTIKSTEDISRHGCSCYVAYVKEIKNESFLWVYTTYDEVKEILLKSFEKDLVELQKKKQDILRKIERLRFNPIKSNIS